MQTFRMNSNVAGVGDHGEIVEADPQLFTGLIEAGYMSPVTPEDSSTVSSSTSSSSEPPG